MCCIVLKQGDVGKRRAKAVALNRPEGGALKQNPTHYLNSDSNHVGTPNTRQCQTSTATG
jgi:hypothetical protein